MWKIITLTMGVLLSVSLVLCGLQAHRLMLAQATIENYRQLEERRADEVSLTTEMVQLSRGVEQRCEDRLAAYHLTLQNLVRRLGLDQKEFQSPLAVHLAAIGGGTVPLTGPDLVQDSKVFLLRKKARAERRLKQCREKLRAP